MVRRLRVRARQRLLQVLLCCLAAETVVLYRLSLSFDAAGAAVQQDQKALKAIGKRGTLIPV